MNREERNRIIIGAIVVAALLAAGAIIFFAPSESLSEAYSVITAFPKQAGLKKGDNVVINGETVGAVQMVTEDTRQGEVPVRMKVSEAAFKSLGPDAVAWIEYSTAERKARVVIQPGKPDGKSRFTKIRPIRGIEGRQWTVDSGQ